MNVSDSTIENRTLTTWVWIDQADITSVSSLYQPPKPKKFDFFKPLRQLLERVDVKDKELAHRLCQMIPAQCPFERDVKLFGRTLFHIPPMCKLNPLYEEVMALRFRAICYLADECGEDVTPYC
ncbi:MAG TPA: Mo-dependent nitrogenase C-terminal domain-containing protein [Leptolyngbyaceae cyanobacterium]